MPQYIVAFFMALVFALAGKMGGLFIPYVRRLQLPAGLIGGLLALLAGPQLLGRQMSQPLLDESILSVWHELTPTLINVVFASLFIGRSIPSLRKILKMSAPQAALGQTMAWGQYLIGGLLTLIVLIPKFGVDESFASLIEVSFQGGIGVAAGMQQTFEQVGAAGATDVALALAPTAMLSGMLIGILFIMRRQAGSEPEVPEEESDVPQDDRAEETRCSRSLLVQLALIGIAIYFGTLILDGLSYLESRVFNTYIYEAEFIRHIPVFPMAMLGGILVQILMTKLVRHPCANSHLVGKIQSGALNLLIIMAMAGISLTTVRNHLAVFGILFVAGAAWNIFCFMVLPKLFFSDNPFERGIADFGQSMGTTSIGLVLFSMADSQNRSGGRESFGFKQLLFEPFVGGGLVTATSPMLIHNIGLWPFTMVALALCGISIGAGIFFRHMGSGNS